MLVVHNTDWSALFCRAKDDVQSSQEIINFYLRSPAECIIQLGIRDLDEIRDKSHAQVFLKSLDPIRRIAGLLLVDYRCPACASVASFCVNHACHDPDPRVRGIALFALLKQYSQIEDPELSLWAVLRNLFICPVDPKLFDNNGLLSARIATLLRFWESARRKVADQDIRRWRDAAGAQFEELLASVESAKECLKAVEPRMRVIALEVLHKYWAISSLEEAEICERFVVNDCDWELKELAPNGFSASGA